MRCSTLWCVASAMTAAACSVRAGTESLRPLSSVEEVACHADGGSPPAPAMDAGDPEPIVPAGRGTESRGLDVDMERAEIYHLDGAMDAVTGEELVLVPGDRVRLFLTAANQSNGWVPINFELCVENQAHLEVLDQGSVELADLGDAPVLEEPCAVRFHQGVVDLIEYTIPYRVRRAPRDEE
ncbi:hypothetical protein HYV74_02395 [Candidatus Uhrbacteria bacterium]|nr:hypothetical protein [Candidatus Uhrbacteria bacterium]